jgi:uncharacterized iron-regulated membrane protein
MPAPERRPRRLLARVHMWIALALGLYIVVLSFSGSIAVFRREAHLRLGDNHPLLLRAMEWLVDLHDNLLAGSAGRRINGIGALLIVMLIVTGLVIWWPGTGPRLWRNLTVGRPRASRRFAWQLHHALGAWSFVTLLVWALTALYFAFPEWWENAVDLLDADLDDAERPGEGVLLLLIKLHFGRFGGLWVRFLWAVLGLLPVVLFVTGFVLWWTRVVRKRMLTR